MKKLIKCGVLLSLVACILLPIANVKKEHGFVASANCSGSAMCVVEQNSGRIIYSKNENAQLPMASTTKVVTAITVIENCNNLDEVITVDNSCVGVEGSSIYLKQGEQLTVKDLLYGLMLRSGNDSAVALACHVAGSVNSFANKMNELAKNIGANNSHFTNPHGLHDENHYTSAYDLAKITAYALKNSTFKQIVSSKSYVIEQTNKTEKRYLTNKNKLLSTLEGCCGVKTGYTKKAGRCLVSACERNNTTYVCVVLNCGPMFEESAKLLDSCFLEYENTKIIDKTKEISNEYYVDEEHGRLYLYTNEDYFYPLTKQEKEQIRIRYVLNVKEPQENGEVGEIKIFLNNHLLKELKLFTMNKIDKLFENKTLQNSELLWEESVNEN